MVTINNKELLDKAGLEAITDEEGNVTIQKKEEELVNGGKWLPKENSRYFVLFENGINSRAEDFLHFDPKCEFEKRHLANGVVFPSMKMAERVLQKYIRAINEEWEEYEKTLNALNEPDNESES
jgi:hypothetical protein